MAENKFSPDIQRRIDALPLTARDFILSDALGAAVQTIGQKHQLHVDQIGALGGETLAAMIGITSVEDFSENIADVLSLNEQKSSAVAKDVNEMIFVRVREGMKASAEPRATIEPPKLPLAAQTPAPLPVQTHEVIMPSSTKAATLPDIAPGTGPSTPPLSASTPASAPKPAIAPNLGSADMILSEKKVAPPAVAPTPAAPAAPAAPATPATSPMPKVDPSQPQNYKADPYREPVE